MPRRNVGAEDCLLGSRKCADLLLKQHLQLVGAHLPTLFAEHSQMLVGVCGPVSSLSGLYVQR